MVSILKDLSFARTANKMVEEKLQTSKEEEKPEEVIEEKDDPKGDPPTPPKDTEGEQTPPETPPAGILLKPEEKEDFEQFQQIKKTTGFTKFAESAKEAIRLKGELTKKQEALTERELIAMNPDYEVMTDEEKEKFRKEKQQEKDILELKAKEKWREDYRKLPPDIKKLIDEKGGEEAFRDFACDPQRAGADLLTVSQSFVFDVAKPEPPQDKKPGLEKGGGGRDQPKPIRDGYTAEEAANLRTNNPALYAKLVKEKRLKIVDK